MQSYYLSSKERLSANQQFFLEFLYALGSDPYRGRHEDAAFVYKEEDIPSGLKELLVAYFSYIEYNLIDAKLAYYEILSQDHDNMVAMRSLGIIEYRLGNYRLAQQYLENYRHNNTQHIFYYHYKDVRVLRMLFICCIRGLRFFAAFRYYYKFVLGSYANRAVSKKYFIL